MSLLSALVLGLSGCTTTLIHDEVKRSVAKERHCAGSEWADNSSVAVLPVPVAASPDHMQAKSSRRLWLTFAGRVKIEEGLSHHHAFIVARVADGNGLTSRLNKKPSLL